MIDCVISTPVPTSQYIHIQLSVACEKGENCRLQLAAWRPGKYFMAQYAQFVRDFKVSLDGEPVKHVKVTKDLWAFLSPEKGTYTITYQYFAGQMDAGGSWLDPEQLYINFINLLFDISGKEESPIRLTLHLPKDFKVATSLGPSGAPYQYMANNYQHLVDSPLIASANIRHLSYEIGDSLFHMWFQGDSPLPINSLIPIFKTFTARQINDFGEFPAKEYHFLFELLPYPHYHGVEHKFSTVITLGPAEKLNQAEYLDALIGVSSHELYHFWNVCRIRPKELLPYDFSKEAYLDSGWLLEGITTYMGDLYLLKSGYYSLERYLQRFQKLMDREFNSWGWKHQSVVESSYDLWLDGYQPGIPDKKVSIYNRGALLSFCLDIALMQAGSSLSELMRTFWDRYGKTGLGYDMNEVREIFGKFSQSLINWNVFFEDYIYGKKDIYPLVVESLRLLGVRCNRTPKANNLAGDFGIIADKKGKIEKIHPAAEAYRFLMIGDSILSYSHSEDGVSLHLARLGKSFIIKLDRSAVAYFHDFELSMDRITDSRGKWMN
jgi:predicted metalloprotease with PDZ domain